MINSPILNGSNFRTGFTAGMIQIPGETAPGVPVGLPIPYTVKFPLPAGTLRTTASLSLTPDAQTFLKLSSFSTVYGTIVPVDSLNQMYMLDYARVVSARITALSTPDTNVNIFASYIDIHGKEGFNQTVLNNVDTEYNPLIAALGLCSIYLTSDAPVTATLEFRLENTFELPVTDYGINSQLLMVSGNNLDNFNGLWMVTANDSPPYLYAWDGVYTNAQATNVPCTITAARPRPWFEIYGEGVPFGDTIEDHTFTFVQNVYGLGSGTQFLNPALPTVGVYTTLTEEVFGPQNFTEGFEPWRG